MTEDIHSWPTQLAATWPALECITLPETASTNNWLHDRREQLNGHTVLALADYQTAGRGSGSNHWEAERGSNLIFSLQTHPHNLPANRMFSLSEVMSLAVCLGLEQHAAQHGCPDTSPFRIKWPNDVYFANGKVCGMLIENELNGRMVDKCVMGVGININQQQFLSQAPNPLSMCHILGRHTPRLGVLQCVLHCFLDCQAMLCQGHYQALHSLYLSRVYRWHEWHRYTDATGTFTAQITDIRPDGHLMLLTCDGQERTYTFGDIKYIIQD